MCINKSKSRNNDFALENSWVEVAIGSKLIAILCYRSITSDLQWNSRIEHFVRRRKIAKLDFIDSGRNFTSATSSRPNVQQVWLGYRVSKLVHLLLNEEGIKWLFRTLTLLGRSIGGLSRSKFSHSAEFSLPFSFAANICSFLLLLSGRIANFSVEPRVRTDRYQVNFALTIHQIHLSF
jgi:hypothetical protein